MSDYVKVPFLCCVNIPLQTYAFSLLVQQRQDWHGEFHSRCKPYVNDVHNLPKSSRYLQSSNYGCSNLAFLRHDKLFLHLTLKFERKVNYILWYTFFSNLIRSMWNKMQSYCQFIAPYTYIYNIHTWQCEYRVNNKFNMKL